jgi:hypothetical protein
MQISTPFSERAYQSLLELADGNTKWVLEALTPGPDGKPVDFSEALERIVKRRVETAKGHLSHTNLRDGSAAHIAANLLKVHSS